MRQIAQHIKIPSSSRIYTEVMSLPWSIQEINFTQSFFSPNSYKQFVYYLLHTPTNKQTKLDWYQVTNYLGKKEEASIGCRLFYKM